MIGDFPVARGLFCDREVIVFRTGMGKNSADAAETLLSDRKPEALLYLGLSGGLLQSQMVGNIVVCEKVCVIQEEAQKHPCLHSDKGLIVMAQKAANSFDGSHSHGVSVTVDHVVNDSSERSYLAENCDAITVDMEGYWLAQIASKHNIPFLSVRVISDSIDDHIPEFLLKLVDINGSINYAKMIAYLFLHPSEWAGFFKMVRSFIVARRRLKSFTNQLLTSWCMIHS